MCGETRKWQVCMSACVWRMGIGHVYDVMYVCVGKLEMTGMYVCYWYVCMRHRLHSRRRAKGRAPHPLPRFMSDTSHRCCMFVTKQIHRENYTCVWRMAIRHVYDVMYVCVGTHTSLEKMTGMYVCVCMTHGYLNVCMTSCLYVWGNIDR